eukprot:8304364-Pyramimonas_sp.AAC.1
MVLAQSQPYNGYVRPQGFRIPPPDSDIRIQVSGFGFEVLDWTSEFGYSDSRFQVPGPGFGLDPRVRICGFVVP